MQQHIKADFDDSTKYDMIYVDVLRILFLIILYVQLIFKLLLEDLTKNYFVHYC